MERSRRANNQANYNADGTIKKGVKAWKYSKRYKRLKAKYAEVNRMTKAKRKQSHEEQANELIAKGTDIRVESMQYAGLMKRAKETKKRKDGRYASKRRYGKIITRRAPKKFLDIVDRKLSYHGHRIKRVNTAKIKASQYNHVSGDYSKKPLSQRYSDIGGHRVQRDLYSAFIIAHTNNDQETVNQLDCEKHYENFVIAQNREVERIRKGDSDTLRWYVAYKMP